MDLLIIFLTSVAAAAGCGITVYAIWRCRTTDSRNIDAGPIPGGDAPPSSPIEAIEVPIMGQEQLSFTDQVNSRFESYRPRTGNFLRLPAGNLEGQPFFPSLASPRRFK